MKKLLIISILSILILSVVGCGKKKQPAKTASPNDDRQPVMVEELTLRSLDEFITVSGKLEGITDVTMSSETAGRLVALYKKLGDRVGRGERIGMVDNSVYKIRLDQSEAAELSAQSAFENAQKNLNYAEEAYKKKLISMAEYNSAVSAFKGAKAALDGAKAGSESARNSYSNSFLIAPESGVISNLPITVGQYIGMGQPIASITDNRILILKTGVGETQITKLKKGQAVTVQTTGVTGNVTGTLKGFGIKPMTGTATYPVEIEIRDANGLLPGMVATAKILSASYKDLLYTSINNILKEFDKNYVFTVVDNKAVRKEIRLGQIIGENVVIDSGVTLGERIVTSGLDNLEDGAPVQIRE